jgi:hypothetical protein
MFNSTLYERILSFLERFLIAISVWYGIRQAEKLKTVLNASEELVEAVNQKNTLKLQIKDMSREEKLKNTIID